MLFALLVISFLCLAFSSPLQKLWQSRRRLTRFFDVTKSTYTKVTCNSKVYEAHILICR